MGRLHSFGFRGFDQRALRPAEAFLPYYEDVVAAPGEAHTRTSSELEIHVEGEEMELHRPERGGSFCQG